MCIFKKQKENENDMKGFEKLKESIIEITDKYLNHQNYDEEVLIIRIGNRKHGDPEAIKGEEEIDFEYSAYKVQDSGRITMKGKTFHVAQIEEDK